MLNVKKKLFGKNERQEKCTLLFRVPSRHSFPFNSQFLYALENKFRFCKSVYGISRFQLHFVFIRVYIFVQQKTWTLETS